MQSVFANPRTNSHYLTSQHIVSAALLPRGYLVRSILVSAVVEGYLQNDNHKFLKETQDVPDFAIDVLREVKATLNTLKVEKGGITCEDPFSGKKLHLKGD